MRIAVWKTLLLVVGLLVFAQYGFTQVKISGKVSDPISGETLIGATVLEKGTTNGTITDFDGKFELSVDKIPVTIQVKFIGFSTQELEVTDNSKPLNIKLKADNVMLDAVEVVDSRVTDKQKQNPLTVESFDVIAIKEAASGNFYESLGNLKGVDMTSASLGFKVINTRGFNSTSPVRTLQLIDGVDNQSPGLNFSLGNFLGASDLDVMKVDIIAGASSAFYGPGAFNGVINMTTKDPFLFPGLSAQVKVGERNMQEYAVRWADYFTNKEGEAKFGYKLNVFYLTANDWEAENMSQTDESDLPETNPGSYDAVNRYGDEGDGASNNDFTNPGGQLSYSGVGAYRPTGYLETDLADYNTENLKLNASLHYMITDSIQAILSSSYSQGTTVYQGDNRFSLKDIQFYQNRIELKKEDKWFFRAYATNEDAGNTYDIVSTALTLQENQIDEATWNSLYSSYFRAVYTPKVKALPGYPQLADYEDLNDWSVNGYEPWIAMQSDSLTAWHNATREVVDSDPRRGDERLQPGTAAFDSAFSKVTSEPLGNGGSRLYDRSALYHAQGEYLFEPKGLDIRVGGNFRLYRPDTRGTIFSDTLTYSYGDSVVFSPNDPTLPIDTVQVPIDSSYTRITNYQYGMYVGLEKKVLNDQMVLSFTVRADKNENFDWLISPALSAVYTTEKNHVLRATFTSGSRNPTLADQFLFYDVGRATLLGNINGYDSLLTVESVENYLREFNSDTLEYFNVDPIKPEQVRTIEVGYRAVVKEKMYVDASAYYSWYTNFIGYEIGVDAEIDPNLNIRDPEVYRIASNSKSLVTTQGVSVGMNYYLTKKLTANANYSYNQLTSGEDDPLIPAFNTPKNKFNLGIGGREIRAPFITIGSFGFNVNYKWVEGFVFEGSPQFTGFIDSYGLLDAQVNFVMPKYYTTIKVGASNVLNNEVYQVYGGPLVGRLGYISFMFDLKK